MVSGYLGEVLESEASRGDAQWIGPISRLGPGDELVAYLTLALKSHDGCLGSGELLVTIRLGSCRIGEYGTTGDDLGSVGRDSCLGMDSGVDFLVSASRAATEKLNR